jgi:hypothetical protein
MPMKWQMHVKL